MRDELKDYYETELTHLRKMGVEFAGKHPGVAERLRMEPDQCADPHVERMIEAFAFLAGRVRLKLDDELPEMTEAFLNVLYPHYLAPIPSMSIALFALDRDQGQLTSAYQIERGKYLSAKTPQGEDCTFRTSYPITLWPIEVDSAAFESPNPVDSRGLWEHAEIRISLRCLNGTKLYTLRDGLDDNAPRIDKLRFYLHGGPQLVYPLYEALFNNVERVELRSANPQPGTLKRESSPLPLKLKAVGFEDDENLLEYTARSFPGYRLLTEYFAFPEKFLFVDVEGLEQAVDAGIGDRFEIVIRLRNVPPPRATVGAETFRLGCTPIVNLFEKTPDPIDLTHRTTEYPIVPDRHRQMAIEVYSVDRVVSESRLSGAQRVFQPFYSFGHTTDAGRQQGNFWYATRRASQRAEDKGTDVHLSFVDLSFSPRLPAVETVTAFLTCTNRDLPAQLRLGPKEGYLTAEKAPTLAPVRSLRNPTETCRPSMRRGAYWRLISHLTLNHLSLVQPGGNGEPDALREILTLYDFQGSAENRKQILGVERVTSRQVARQTGKHIGGGFVRGIETTIQFDEEQYSGRGVFLFAAVLERFLALYASVNSFNQLVATTRQREGVMHRWNPRAGNQNLV